VLAVHTVWSTTSRCTASSVPVRGGPGSTGSASGRSWVARGDRTGWVVHVLPFALLNGAYRSAGRTPFTRDHRGFHTTQESSRCGNTKDQVSSGLP
jgi:hypothetical protein